MIAGRYRLERRVGAGGMGEVYAAVHAFTGKHVAVKLLSDEAVKSIVSLERFLREARAAATIQHPAVCEVLDAGRAPDGTFYLALELLEGEDLAGPIDRRDLSLDETIQVGVQTLDGLAAAHACGIIHRDIKPENLFLTRDDRGDLRVKILDFGIAKRMNARADVAVTQEGMTVGTPYYMSPEQAGAEELDGRTDIWSIGAVLYHALAGHPPHDEPQYNRLVAKILTQDPPDLARLRPDLPAWLTETVQRALSRDRAQRWPSAQHMAAALREQRISDLGLDWDPSEDLTTRTESPFGGESVRPPPMAFEAATEPLAAPQAVNELAATMGAQPAASRDAPPERSGAHASVAARGESPPMALIVGGIAAAVVILGMLTGVLLYMLLF